VPGLLIGGKEVEVPGLKILNSNDDPRLRRGPEDGAERGTSWVRQVILHTTKGIPGGANKTPQTMKPGAGPDLGKEFDVNKFWTTERTVQSGAHLIIDVDGSVGCVADLEEEKMYHAGQRGINDRSIGIEIYQLEDGGIYEASLDTAVKLCNALAAIFGIQKQVHLPYAKKAIKRLETGGEDCVGFFGHRDVSNNRGFGDPGDLIFEKLKAAGYESYNFDKGEDLIAWKARQTSLGFTGSDIDGIPGPRVIQKLKDTGRAGGLWIPNGPIAPAATPDAVEVSCDAAIDEAVDKALRPLEDQIKALTAQLNEFKTLVADTRKTLQSGGFHPK
jgi:hypothetical protein